MNRPSDIAARRGGFTLVEVLISIGLLGLTAAISITALTHMNNRAFLSRCQTGASTIAQNHIDLILSNMPFNPQKNQVPPELALGTTSTGTAANPTVPVYTDPRTGSVSVRGWISTTVANTSTTYNGVSLSVYRATVTVHYRFRGKPYSVALSTLRCSDI